jgi:hypothetical protein
LVDDTELPATHGDSDDIYVTVSSGLDEQFGLDEIKLTNVTVTQEAFGRCAAHCMRASPSIGAQ